MTITTTIQCDAFSCSREHELNDDSDGAIESSGWVTDPRYGHQHYCPKCWPKVKQELEEDDDE